MGGAGDASALADGTAPLLGFLTRISLQTGPTLEDAVYPNKIELPFKSGEEASFEYAEEIEAEGGAGSAAQVPAADSFVVVAPAANAIAANTPVNTPLSFAGGKWQVAVAGQIAEFALVEIQQPVLANNIRIRARRLPGPIKA